MIEKLKKTPLHPQWFSFRHEERHLKTICAQLGGTVVDIGCADGKPRKYLPDDANYVGIDYFETATNWYETRPEIFADAQLLPLQDNAVDHVLLLDVLEHLPDPERCLAEVHRVLKPRGTFTLQVPFLYPIHDSPLDFHRWTANGLQRAATKHGFRIDAQQAIGHPVETAALNANIALSKTTLNWISGKNPLAITAVLLPFAILAVNCIAWLVALVSRSDDMMPHAYQATWVKE